MPELGLLSKIRVNELTEEQRKEKYEEALKLAKSSENEAINYALACMLFAPAEDIARIAEILKDENDHDAIYTDLLFKSVTGDKAGAENTIYYNAE